jgi:hypothetical protein
MKDKLIVFLVVVLTSWAINNAFAITRLQSMCYYFDSGRTEQVYKTGDFRVSNSIDPQTNHIIQTNQFVDDGGSDIHQQTGQTFWQGVQELVAENAVNVDAITNQATGQTGVYYGPDFIGQTDLNASN